MQRKHKDRRLFFDDLINWKEFDLRRAPSRILSELLRTHVRSSENKLESCVVGTSMLCL